MVASDGLISKAKDNEARTDMEGHLKLIAYPVIHPGENGSMYLLMVLNEVEPGGEILPHYHRITPPCDHAYYVISGDIMATFADREERVGPDTLIYCTTDVIHGLKNVGDTPAKLLRIGAAANGVSSGGSVFLKRE